MLNEKYTKAISYRKYIIKMKLIMFKLLLLPKYIFDMKRMMIQFGGVTVGYLN